MKQELIIYILVGIKHKMSKNGLPRSPVVIKSARIGRQDLQ